MRQLEIRISNNMKKREVDKGNRKNKNKKMYELKIKQINKPYLTDYIIIMYLL